MEKHKGGSRTSMNSNKSRAPTHGSLADPQTYGMLLWQSKLQDKLLQEQKEKRQKDLENEKSRTKENAHFSEKENNNQNRSETSSNVEIPQMLPGPSAYIVTPTTPKNLSSPAFSKTDSARPYANISNGTNPAFEVGQQQQPMFPNISGHMRGSISCDNFGKPSSSLLGNMISFQQMGGAGCPRRSPSGKLLTALRGDPEIRYHQKDTRGFDQTIRYLMDRDKVKAYKLDLDKQLEEKKRWRSRLGSGTVKEITRKEFIENESRRGSKAGTGKIYDSEAYSQDRLSGGYGKPTGSELAPLMRKFNSFPRLNALNSTDVTRPYVHSPRNEFFHPIQANEVAETLSSQLREKARLTRKQQEKESAATEKHFQTWDSLWGRPGGGAPIPFGEKTMGHAVSFGNLYDTSRPGPDHFRGSNHALGYNRVNLFKALHMTHQQPTRLKQYNAQS